LSEPGALSSSGNAEVDADNETEPCSEIESIESIADRSEAADSEFES
jgi:hypothetical protein